jgi:hypothetical protein
MIKALRIRALTVRNDLGMKGGFKRLFGFGEAMIVDLLFELGAPIFLASCHATWVRGSASAGFRGNVFSQQSNNSERFWNVEV